MSLNYSKWDNIVCSSDDDEDCHPNIDKKLWRRLMKEKRERKTAEELHRKGELEKENAADQKKLSGLQEKLKEAEDKTSINKEISSIEAAVKKRDRELLAIERRKKYTPEEMCHVVDERTIVNSSKKIDTDLSKMDYEEYIKKFEKKLETYSKLRTTNLSQGFLIKNPELLHDHCSGYLLLKCLELEMNGDSATMKDVVKQYLIVQYVLDFHKSMGKGDPRDVLNPFFSKLEDSEKMQGLKDEVESFAEKIKARAKVKLEEQAKEREEKKTFVGEDGKEYEYVELTKEERLGPGGLDPLEVLETLPKSLKDAFTSKDIEALQKAIKELPVEEAKYHMDRCTKSGLWNPAGDEE
mmetsp:Transcript_10116/g.18422  ORF Transcript_10116/g.18422 Transcript_10116/m.18422 type:complete len:353 (+) Transcript_10116:110-1168(+)|eukprot:CAMPEP_0197521112 /NCGR_PEP_ID=MMETSP1318-20131121/6396_1 /TAXON_ID=552666 /ORGANISM="Partenskyella glossopodia, Strain RCC365" /LENGTH=352 /DNA_ID=CAMNT_0043072943 /DNA_START=169 /DNA_END=1227 /DNA_ORIENTATION=+